MVEVIWTDNAIEDLNDIGEYIARDSERYAEITVLKQNFRGCYLWILH